MNNNHKGDPYSAWAGAEKRLQNAMETITDLRAELAQMQAREVCTGCGTKQIDAVVAIIKGAVACCPDCTTLTVDERNQIRAALKQEARKVIK